MRKLILYSAVSLDGFIARSNGDIDWLFQGQEGQDYGYHKFSQSVDTVIMGGKTFRQVLGFGEPFPYEHKNCFVYTRDVALKYKPAKFIHHDLIEHTKSLKDKGGKNIWLIGGGQINTMHLNAGLIDEIQLFIHPVLLGHGIRLFENEVIENWLVPQDVEEFSDGMIRITYHRKEKPT
jgi:dihydrofolate reductase